MDISEAGLNLIKQSEGFQAHVYKDIVGVDTIGYGHALKPGESFPQGITQDQATALLLSDVASAEHAVSRLVTVDLTQGQFDALVSFVFNLGAARLQQSTLLRDLNAGQYTAAADQFLLWDHAGGKEVTGLKLRREAERTLFLS